MSLLYYVCSLPNPGEPGSPKELFSDDPKLIERFIKAEDRPGRGVYECINPLVPGAKRRSLETVAELRQLYFDLDVQNILATGDEVLTKVRQLPVTLSWGHDSGSGNFHVGVKIKDPPPPGTPEYDRLSIVWKSLAEKLAADPAPTHPAALIRCVGTHNTKNGNSGLCRVLWNGGAPLDLTELEALDDLLVEPLLKCKPRPANNNSQAETAEHRPPVDVEARLAAMCLKGPGDSSVHQTQLSCTASLLRSGVALEETTRIVLEATRAAVANDIRAANWNWREEELDIMRMGCDLIVKHPELANLLPDAWRERFETARAEGRRPDVGRNRGGLYFRAWRAKPDAGESASPDAHEKAKANAGPGGSGARVILKPFVPIDPASLPCRQWLYGKHYQRRIVSATIAPGGTGKTSLVMVEAVALATCRNLLDEQPETRCRVWLHNGEDSREELNRRVVAICQHYKIPQQELQDWLFLTSGTEMALKVANGYSDLRVDGMLVAEMTKVIADNSIDVVMLDPLVTLHSVNESDNGKMDAVIRIFTKLADVCDCSVDISHHTRKLAAGTFDHTVDDTRGASSVRDAVRALRILNIMSQADAENFGFDDFERLSYFRVDRGKANAVAPARAATWRKFESVELANGDDVGVIAPWQMPAKSPEKQAQDDRLFLQLLDRFAAEGRNVNAIHHVNYAPKLFSKDPVAKTAKVSLLRLEQAMQRLLASGQIETEKFGRSDRPSARIVRAGKSAP